MKIRAILLSLSLFAGSLTAYQLPTETTDSFCGFSVTNYMPQPAAGIAAVLGPDKKIYAIGGYGYFMNAVPVASNLIRIFDTNTSSWSVAPVQLTVARMYLAAISCPDGKIIIAGGISQLNQGLNSVEMFDPASPTDQQPKHTVVIGTMSCVRKSPVLNLLDDGRILITGEEKQADIIEIDATGNYKIRPTKGVQNTRRNEHAGLKLTDGRILLITGRNKSMEIFDPKTESFTMVKAKFENSFDDQAAALLSNGKVLIVGGQNSTGTSCSNQTWIYDPKIDTLTPGIKLQPVAESENSTGISDMQIVDLSQGQKQSGKVFLLCGGEDDNGKKDIILSSAWLYITASNEFIEVGPMNQPHDDFKAVPFSDEKVLKALIIDGHSTNDKITGCVEIFNCQPGISK